MKTINPKNKIVIATGGTGGHVFPAVSLAEHLTNNYDVMVTTDQRGLVYLNKLLKKFKIKTINSSTIFKKNPLKIFYSLFLILFSTCKSFVFLKNFKPKIVIGMGGYSSFPVCVSALILKIPVIIYENNLLIGKANKYLLPLVDKIFLSTPETKGIKPKYENKIFISGNFIRQEIENYRHNIDYRDKKLKIVIMGGSQAAKIFGEVLPQIFVECKKVGIHLSIVQQCLDTQKEYLTNFYNTQKIDNEVFTFRSDITQIFKNTSFVITRGGASAQAELINCNIPYIVVPLKNSTDDHQFENASYYKKKGCNFLVIEEEIETKLLDLIKMIDKDKTKLYEIVQNQKKLFNQNVLKNADNQINMIINK